MTDAHQESREVATHIFNNILRPREYAAATYALGMWWHQPFSTVVHASLATEVDQDMIVRVIPHFWYFEADEAPPV